MYPFCNFYCQKLLRYYSKTEMFDFICLQIRNNIFPFFEDYFYSFYTAILFLPGLDLENKQMYN